MALAAGRLGALPLAAQSVIMTLDQSVSGVRFLFVSILTRFGIVLNTIPFGIGEFRQVFQLLL